jgi:hypothetical protein
LLIADGPREQTAARRGGNELHMDLARVKGKLGASARPGTTG